MAGATDAKRRSAAVWSSNATQYAQEAHEGSSIMMPLVKHIAGIVVAKVGDTDDAAVLDLAAGPGEPSISIAAALPRCSVTSTDLAPGMVAEAQRRAAARGLHNVRAEVADAEDLAAYPDARFDVVTCCAGLMMMDAPKALLEWRRVLKPGGLLIVSVWGPPGETTQMMGLYMTLIHTLRAEVPHQPPPAAAAAADEPAAEDPTHANLKSMGEDGVLATLGAAAGFRHIDVRDFNVPMAVAPDAIEAAMLETPMAADVLRTLHAAGRSNIHQEALALVKETAAERGLMAPHGGLLMPRNMAVVMTATA